MRWPAPRHPPGARCGARKDLRACPNRAGSPGCRYNRLCPARGNPAPAAGSCGQDGCMVRPVPRHDHDAGGPAEVLAAKATLRQEVWSAMRAARVARFPGAAGRIPNFTGAEAAAERLRGTPAWQAAGTLKANPDSAQLPVRQRALEDGKTVYMAVPRLAGPEPFFALDPDHLSEPPRKAASISGASRSARRVALAG